MNSKIVASKNDTSTVSASSFRRTVLLMVLKVVMYSAVLAGVVFILLQDAQRPMGMKFIEQSYTEYAQESGLLLTIILFYLCVYFFPEQAVVGYLFGGFFGMAFIREYDAFLDENVADGTWQVLAYSLAAVTAFLVYRKRKFFWQQLNSFIECRPFGIVITGMMIVFIFSRLYGLKNIWESIMNEDYMHIITRAGEESIELLGYTVILIGAMEYFFYLKRLEDKEIMTNEVESDTEEQKNRRKLKIAEGYSTPRSKISNRKGLNV